VNFLFDCSGFAPFDLRQTLPDVWFRRIWGAIGPPLPISAPKGGSRVAKTCLVRAPPAPYKPSLQRLKSAWVHGAHPNTKTRKPGNGSQFYQLPGLSMDWTGTPAPRYFLHEAVSMESQWGDFARTFEELRPGPTEKSFWHKKTVFGIGLFHQGLSGKAPIGINRHSI